MTPISDTQEFARRFNEEDAIWQRQRLVSADSGKLVEESFQTVPAFQIIEEMLNRYARVGKDWCATHLFRVAFD